MKGWGCLTGPARSPRPARIVDHIRVHTVVEDLAVDAALGPVRARTLALWGLDHHVPYEEEAMRDDPGVQVVAFGGRGADHRGAVDGQGFVVPDPVGGAGC